MQNNQFPARTVWKDCHGHEFHARLPRHTDKFWETLEVTVAQQTTKLEQRTAKWKMRFNEMKWMNVKKAFWGIAMNGVSGGKETTKSKGPCRWKSENSFTPSNRTQTLCKMRNCFVCCCVGWAAQPTTSNKIERRGNVEDKWSQQHLSRESVWSPSVRPISSTEAISSLVIFSTDTTPSHNNPHVYCR